MKKQLLILITTILFFSCRKICEPPPCEERFVAKYSLDTYFARNIKTIEMTVSMDAPGVVATQVINGSGSATYVYNDSLDITEAISSAMPGEDLIQFQWKITDKQDNSYMVTKSYNTRKPVDKSWYGHPVVLSDYFGSSQSLNGIGLEYVIMKSRDHHFTLKNTSSVESVIEYEYNDNISQVTMAPGSTFYFRTSDEHFSFKATNITINPEESIEFTDKLSVYTMRLNDINIKLEKQKSCGINYLK